MHNHEWKRRSLSVLVAFCSALLCGCGGGSDAQSLPGVVAPHSAVPTQEPLALTMVGTINSATLASWSHGARESFCAVDVYRFTYGTVGSLSEPTDATSALLLPAPDCRARKANAVLLYAHGTSWSTAYDQASLVPSNPAFPALQDIATNFAGRGYTVIAPNYAGYAGSALGYIPYLDKAQQAQDALDAYRQGMTALATLGVSATGPLFIDGYSQGGYVAMDAARALQDAGITVAAATGGSGPYALSALMDQVFLATPDAWGSDAQVQDAPFLAMLAADLARRYGPALPSSALTTPAYDPSRFTQSPGAFLGGFTLDSGEASAYLEDIDQHPDPADVRHGVGMPNAATSDPWREAVAAQDLRGFAPSMPFLLCGGSRDPIVPWDQGGGEMGRLWAQSPAVTFGELNVDPQTGPAWRSQNLPPAIAASMAALASTQSQAFAQSLSTQTDPLSAYHGLLEPYCTAAARAFFDDWLSAQSAGESVAR